MSDSYLKLLNQRRADYKTWKPIYCPAVNDYVFFNMQGFDHLNFKRRGIERKRKEAMYKLGLLPLVRPVIHKSKTVTKYESRTSYIKQFGKDKSVEIKYWAIEAVVGKQYTKLRVILRKVKGRIYFWSVMKLKV